MGPLEVLSNKLTNPAEEAPTVDDMQAVDTDQLVETMKNQKLTPAQLLIANRKIESLHQTAGGQVKMKLERLRTAINPSASAVDYLKHAGARVVEAGATVGETGLSMLGEGTRQASEGLKMVSEGKIAKGSWETTKGAATALAVPLAAGGAVYLTWKTVMNTFKETSERKGFFAKLKGYTWGILQGAAVATGLGLLINFGTAEFREFQKRRQSEQIALNPDAKPEPLHIVPSGTTAGSPVERGGTFRAPESRIENDVA
jgi:hypothetical protein